MGVQSAGPGSLGIITILAPDICPRCIINIVRRLLGVHDCDKINTHSLEYVTQSVKRSTTFAAQRVSSS